MSGVECLLVMVKRLNRVRVLHATMFTDAVARVLLIILIIYMISDVQVMIVHRLLLLQ